MENLLSQWGLVKEQIKGKNVLLFLDYDGTLAPIVGHPEDATMSSDMRDTLSFLSVAQNIVTIVISGRAIEDIAGRVSIAEIIYVGNHGFQIRSEAIGSQDFAPVGYQAVISEMAKKLRKAVGKLDGVLIEDKHLTLSCHFRLVRDEDVPYARSLFEVVVLPYVKAGQVRIVEGKKVMEIRPLADWDKGKAVLWFLGKKLFVNHEEVVPIYVGDDATDIDAFKALQGKGITVWVGKEPKFPTGYCLKDTTEVGEFLKKLRVLSLGKEDA
jgi:trehalose-phosphatase